MLLTLIVLVPFFLSFFLSELGLFVCDLPFKILSGVQAYSRSWIDHVLCSASHSSPVTDVHSLRSGHILSDHFFLYASLPCC